MPPTVVEPSKTTVNPGPVIGTVNIISKNIFDPERGAGLTREAELNSQAFQRIRSMVLLGTAIIGDSRFAILQDGGAAPGKPTIPNQSPVPMRIKVGDMLEGFSLSEISERRVVFAKGATVVEVPLDYFRKIDATQSRASVAAPRNLSGQATPPRFVTSGQATAPAQKAPAPPLPRRRDREPASGEYGEEPQ